MYDYLIVGAGLFGSTFAYEMTKAGKKCLIIEKKNHIGELEYRSLKLLTWHRIFTTMSKINQKIL